MTTEEADELDTGDLILVDGFDWNGKRCLLVCHFVDVNGSYIVFKYNDSLRETPFEYVEGRLFVLASLLPRLVREYV